MAKRRGHGEGSIHQRSDGRWCAVVDLGVISGKRKRKYVYGTTRKEVADKLKELHSQQQQGFDIARDKITVAQFLEQWLAQVVQPNRRLSTYHSYSDMVRLHIVSHIGTYELVKLTPAHVQAMLNELARSGLSSRTVQYIRSSVLSGALRVAVRWGYVTRNVATLTDPPRVNKYIVKPLTLSQAKLLLEAVKGHRLEALYRVALSLGLRKGEVLGLRWEDVDLEKRTLRIAIALQRLGKKGSKSELLPPKTPSSIRTLPLPQVLIQVLHDHRERQDKERQSATWKEHGLVFPSEVGTPKEPRNLITHFKRVLKKAGLPLTTRFHDLRHSYATLLIAQGEHPRVVMELMGHSQISVTMNTYGHVLPDTQREATERLAALFDEAEKEKEEE